MTQTNAPDMREYIDGMHEKMDAAGVHFNDLIRCPLWSEYNWGCTIEKPFGVRVIVFCGVDTDMDTSFLDENDEADADLLAHIEGYVIGAFLMDEHGKLIEWDTCGTTVDGRDSWRYHTAYFGEIALDLMAELQDKIDTAVKAAGERVARYI